jgi:hypothetical protein
MSLRIYGENESKQILFWSLLNYKARLYECFIFDESVYMCSYSWKWFGWMLSLKIFLWCQSICDINVISISAIVHINERWVIFIRVLRLSKNSSYKSFFRSCLVKVAQIHPNSSFFLWQSNQSKSSLFYVHYSRRKNHIYLTCDLRQHKTVSCSIRAIDSNIRN